MNDELAEIRISNLEQRIDRLVQEVALGKQSDNVQNAQLAPFVPIPGIAGEDPKPFDIETDAEGARFVVRCVFYCGKEEIELADYALGEIPASGDATLYLTRSISEGEPIYALTTDEPVEGDEVTSYYKIYDFTDGEVSCDYRATFLTLGISANGDKVSIDTVTADDAEDPNALQIKDFDNEESNGGQGLAERLEVRRDGSGESASYRIITKSNESKVHLIARVNGKIKYIPISGNDEKDPDEENPPPEDDPCAHPGDNGSGGGVQPPDAGDGGGGTAGDGEDAAGGGGVAPGGDAHPGDDNCNC